MNHICEKYFNLIEDLVGGESVGEQTGAQVEAHVFDCAECRNEYELLRREKEVLAHYMFDFEEPPDSWTNFQARLIEEEANASDVIAVNAMRRKRHIFAFGFSPAFAAAGLLLIFGIGFVWLKNAPFERNADKSVVETQIENQPSPQSDEVDSKSATNLQSGNIATASDDAPKNNESKIGNETLRAKNISPSGKKYFSVEKLKTIRETASFGFEKKRESETVVKDEARAATLRRQNLETEIAGQIEKIELLLRSFRNAQATENAASFDVEYEKRQARRLLETNVALRRDAEKYEIAYAEELLSRVDSYLLEIANLGSNPAPEKVLDIKERVSSQNVIASLQVYSSVAAR